jgi:lipoate-protein ligase A
VRTWRLITTFGAAPAFNMGLDEALLESRGAPAALRLYTWRPPALSLGYFQRFAEVAAALDAPVVVRRITGGGAILHDQGELTFSIAADEDEPVFAGSIGDSYRRVHAAIASALAAVGVRAGLRGPRALASDVGGTGMCFHRSTELDLAWEDRKGVGSAQRRRGGRVLHHGSIKVRASAAEAGVATVAEHWRGATPELLAPLVREAFERELGLAFEAAVPEKEERERAKELAARYVDPAFVRRR